MRAAPLPGARGLGGAAIDKPAKAGESSRMPSVAASQRHQAILARLEAKGSVHVSDLARSLGVSEVTVRADLAYLEDQQALTRARGGAIRGEPTRSERPVEIAGERNSAEKRRIGQRAGEMVRDNETVLVDVGSTCGALARQIPAERRNVLVVTPALDIALILESHPGIQVIVTGGTLRSLQHSLVNPYGQHLIEQITADTAFIGCNGVDTEAGFTNTNIDETEIKAAMLRAARRAVFLADHTKLGMVATARIAPFERADLLITDSGADSAVLAPLRATGLDVESV